jgi:hypothetical protein
MVSVAMKHILLSGILPNVTIPSVIMMNVIMLIVAAKPVLLSVIIPNVVKPNVVASSNIKQVRNRNRSFLSEIKWYINVTVARVSVGKALLIKIK